MKGKLARFALAQLAVILAATSAHAGFATPRIPQTSSPAVPIQYREADVFFDGQGNRILLDRETGEIISVRPVRPRERTRPMRRPLPDNGPFSDEPAYEEPNYDQGEFDGPADDFPPAPRGDDQGEVAREEQPAPRPRAVERKSLPQPSAKPDAPAETTATRESPAERPGDEPIFADPGSQPAETATAPAQPAAPATPEVETAPAAPPAEETALGEPNGSIENLGDPQTTGATTPGETPAVILPKVSGSVPDVAALQILLDRGGSSPGVIDGRFGSNVDRAIAAYRRLTGKNLKSTDTALIKQLLAETGGDPFTTYTLTAEDVAGPFVASVPEDYGKKAKMERLSFTSVAEMIAERFHMDENYLKAINPEANFNRVGTIISVANVGQNVTAKVARITADKAQKQVLAYDAYNKLVAAYPATIGSAATPSPTGTHAVSRIAFNPEYTYNPKINFKQGDNDKVLTIPPGPNGPVGSIWIALDKPTYGVHGTPEPSKIGKTESHGCVRLTNWDAAELAKLVTAGVTVEFLE